MPVAVFSHPACLAHDPGPGHPESPERLKVIRQALEREAFSSLLHKPAPTATVEALARCHESAYIADILAIAPPAGQYVMLDPDTLMSSGSAEAARRAAGAAMAGVDAVMEGWARAAFAAVRPPGHHAGRARAMGFCLFNNAALAAAHARARWQLNRVAVVDFDVHHGNGTQALLEGDGGFFYASTHQAGAYPGTGRAEEHGVAGNLVNAPLPAGAGGAEFRAAWEERILPALAAFGPELLIISAGFDAHRADPLASLRLEIADFIWISERLVEAAEASCGGRLVSVLEGGYDLGALAASVSAHVRALMRS